MYPVCKKKQYKRVSQRTGRRVVLIKSHLWAINFAQKAIYLVKWLSTSSFTYHFSLASIVDAREDKETCLLRFFFVRF
jgi:hypothetical protein